MKLLRPSPASFSPFPPLLALLGLAAWPMAAQAVDNDRALDDTPRLERSECATEALAELGAQCYLFHGEENREAPNGTRVELPIGVIEPDGEATSEVPVFFFPGGPGYSSLGNADYIAQLRKDIGDRTLVVMDHRGFVHATPSLDCPDYAAVSPYHNVIHTPAITASLDPMERLEIITAGVEACYRELDEAGIDLSQYNAHAVSRDVEEIRALLGYERIDAFGSSTGSGTLLSYIQYHPESVRAAILGWPWFNSLRNRSPVDEFHTTKQKHTDILALCVTEDEACRELLPAWFHEIDRTRRRLDARPFVATLGEGEEATTLYFDGAAFLDTLYLTLASDYAMLPRLIAEIREGDYSSLGEFFRLDDYDPEPQAPTYALGYFLAHVCNDMGGNRPTRADSIAAVQREPAILGFEPPWLCAWWGEDGDVPVEHSDPLVSEVPVLALHGQMDPCCDTRWSEHLARTMPNLQYVEFQGLGHNPVNECRSRMIDAFLAAPEEPVDDSCKDEVALEPWELRTSDGHAQ